MVTHLGPNPYYSSQIKIDDVVADPNFNNIFFYLSQKYDIPGYLTDTKTKFHYTNATGLVGIIESHRLWATEIKFLNDPSEGSYFPGSIIKKMIDSAKINNKTHEAIIISLRNKIKKLNDEMGIFTVSFCDNGDLLSQWRAYGSFGVGYAVGLQIQTPGFRPWVPYRIKYSIDGLDEIGNELLLIYTAVIAKQGPDVIDRVISELANVLRAISVSFKHEAYVEEQETRIVTSRLDGHVDEMGRILPVKFRTRNGDIIPYIPLALEEPDSEESRQPRLPITEIVIGPGVDAKRNAASIKRLLQLNGYEHVLIRTSSIPLRP